MINQSDGKGLIKGLEGHYIRNYLNNDVLYSEILENLFFSCFELLIAKSTLDYIKQKYGGFDQVITIENKQDKMYFFKDVYKNVKSYVITNFHLEYKAYVEL